MPFNIIRNDITKVKTDAIVNTANPEVAIGDGSDSAIYAAAGRDELFAERAKIGRIKRGQAAVTPAFNLSAKYIIHTVGPVWIYGNETEIQTLSDCYQNSLMLALELGCKSIAFPLISSGTYGFPKEKALQTAVETFSAFLMDHEMDILLVVYDRESFKVSEKLLSDVQSFIDDEYTHKFGRSTSDIRQQQIMRRRRLEHLDIEALVKEDRIPDCTSYTDMSIGLGMPCSDMVKKESIQSLDELLERPYETFSEMLLRKITESGLSDSQVYHKANIDRKLFSKIRCNAKYQPKKETVMSFAIALELNMDETIDLMAKAGYAFSPANRQDKIIKYFILNERYDIYEINEVLFQYNEKTLA